MRKGDRYVYDLHSPEYTVTEQNLAESCQYKEWECQFWFGIRQPADTSKWLTWVTTM